MRACSVLSTLCDSPGLLPGSSTHAISQARILEWMPFPTPGDLPDPGIEPMSPALTGGFFTSELSGKPQRRTAASAAAAAAAAKSLQSCLTLCDPIAGSPPGSLVSGILQARTLEWVASSFSNA